MKFKARWTDKDLKTSRYYKYVYPYKKFNFPLPNCTTYAYGRSMEIAAEYGADWTDIEHYNNPWWFTGQSTYGDAETWFQEAKDHKLWKTGKEPKLGAIACWAGTRHHKGGHVAVVEDIEENGYICLSNSDYNGRLFYVQQCKPVPGEVTGYVDEVFLGYIYNPIVKEPEKSDEEIAREVIAGKWGNGKTRKEALIKAGYNYTRIQTIVNRILSSSNTLKVGTKVRTIATGRETSGGSGKYAKKGMTGMITRILPNAKYPYLVSGKLPIGWYQAKALEIL